MTLKKDIIPQEVCLYNNSHFILFEIIIDECKNSIINVTVSIG